VPFVKDAGDMIRIVRIQRGFNEARAVNR